LTYTLSDLNEAFALPDADPPGSNPNATSVVELDYETQNKYTTPSVLSDSLRYDPFLEGTSATSWSRATTSCARTP